MSVGRSEPRQRQSYDSAAQESIIILLRLYVIASEYDSSFSQQVS